MASVSLLTTHFPHVLVSGAKQGEEKERKRWGFCLHFGTVVSLVREHDLPPVSPRCLPSMASAVGLPDGWERKNRETQQEVLGSPRGMWFVGASFPAPQTRNSGLLLDLCESCPHMVPGWVSGPWEPVPGWVVERGGEKGSRKLTASAYALGLVPFSAAVHCSEFWGGCSHPIWVLVAFSGGT